MCYTILSILPQSVFNETIHHANNEYRRLSILPQSVFNMRGKSVAVHLFLNFQSYLSPCLTCLRRNIGMRGMCFQSYLSPCLTYAFPLTARTSGLLSILPQSVFNEQSTCSFWQPPFQLSILPQSVFNTFDTETTGQDMGNFQSYLSPCLTRHHQRPCMRCQTAFQSYLSPCLTALANPDERLDTLLSILPQSVFNEALKRQELRKAVHSFNPTLVRV